MADSVKGGMIQPSVEAIKEFLEKFEQELAEDENLRGAFAMYPREVLSDRGINHDLQTEMLQWLGSVDAASCLWTCMVTGDRPL